MRSEWRFDENNPYEDAFEEALLVVVDSPEVFNVIKRKFEVIAIDPKGEEFRTVVQGRVVYIAFTGPGYLKDAKTPIEPLVIAYTLDEPRRLIQKVFVCKAAEVVDDAWGKTMRSLSPILREAIARAFKNARKRKK